MGFPNTKRLTIPHPSTLAIMVSAMAPIVQLVISVASKMPKIPLRPLLFFSEFSGRFLEFWGCIFSFSVWCRTTAPIYTSLIARGDEKKYKKGWPEKKKQFDYPGQPVIYP
jgi:hypothetical protein